MRAHSKQFHDNFTMCKAVYAVIWCWPLGEVCHTFITYENEAIYVNFKFLLVLCEVKIPFSWALLNVQQLTFSDDILSDIPPSNVWSESPFETITTASHCIQLYMLSFGVQLLDRSVTYLLLQKMY